MKLRFAVALLTLMAALTQGSSSQSFVNAGQPDPGERARLVSAAKVRVGEAARFVGQQAVQLHGGIGVTDELAVSHYFKRLTMFEIAFGDSDHHLESVGKHLFD